MGDFLGRMFGISNNSDLANIMRQNQTLARQQTDIAIEAQTKAQQQAAAALVTPADSESAQLSGEAIMRRRRRSLGPELDALGAAPVSYKMLMGQG